MASESTERSLLLPSSTSTASNPPKPQRTVTFHPETTISHAEGPITSTSPLRPAPQSSPSFPSGPPNQPKLSALNSKLRRRNSHGSPLAQPPMLPPASKIGPQRTTKNAQKLKLLPNPDPGEDGPDEESGRDVYSQFTRIKDPTARRDAARLGKADRDKLPRVTAYCTASSYQLEKMMKYLKSRHRTRGTNPKQFDECIYTTFSYDYGRPKKPKSNTNTSDSEIIQIDNPEPDIQPNHERRYSDSAIEVEENKHQNREDLIDLSTTANDDLPLEPGSSNPNHHPPEDFDTHVSTPEIFLFEYGTVVIWGMTFPQETRFLSELSKFELEKLSPENIQTEAFNFYYTKEYQARIYNDFISLREKRNYMIKLAISHALAQSVKTSLFEDLLTTTIETTAPLPAEIALTGSISLSRRQIHQQIGQLFILRINIHLQGSVLDSPELMWAEPSLEPVYAAVRSYLEMDQRVGLLTERLSVIGDLLAVLKDQVGTKHGEYLEWIVIVLIAAEILVAAINIVVDLYAGVD
ncbi:hypothetical protein MMC21_004246 [Puttea exsequens]|nr:hypothetical protein [Puttea exsequens]